ncbi:putative tetratricopeptide repeat protein [Monocercomonoides exilis]|uniref:putative tetratricopeptide repeat protein n=1 Tax=Monocercomonoides exilis TaxID=2049356 RepID=UPI00355A8F09|nr:putative tetratricopeptide repeat protein [Monocercomonoides exilis]|eukprot:MONOS_8227.1-p1 / transcript=MONOS_8227.1 / gene=MONOS_8227 / organism=Monocercomonoides_exilis_PA203 / gene_product=Tetratricopeptide TPR2 and Tetratricopeptide TPR-3 and Serine threonine protein kinase-related domain containing protein / transcript_product=Tetratricopeptide TPR2 and Tetratricopeptide TPR-3 and Serine threonine protein kinase-related domain containing protein / location=Mono_scaffold00304:41979-46069(+) / protein_length=1269 / sequence_SO=supercontig / SO=protein_coding / is_ps
MLEYNKKNEEALECAKHGVSLDMENPDSWYFLGMIYQNQRNYQDALKCFMQARQKDLVYHGPNRPPDPKTKKPAADETSDLILRELASTQIMCQDFEGYKGSRQMLLSKVPSQKSSWTGFIAGNALTRDYQKALEITNVHIGTINEERCVKEDLNGMYFYKVNLLCRLGKWEEALSVLDEKQKVMLDSAGWTERRGEILLRLGRKDEAKICFKDCLDVNSENAAYHAGYRASIGLDEPISKRSDALYLLAVYQQLSEKYPRSIICLLEPLHLISPSLFPDLYRSVFFIAFHTLIPRAIPSLFSAIEPLLGNCASWNLILSVSKACEESIQKNREWPKNLIEEAERMTTEVAAVRKEKLGDEKDQDTASSSSSPSPSPSALSTEVSPSDSSFIALFINHLLDHFSLYHRAFCGISSAIASAPTFHELILCSARILKHMGAKHNASREACLTFQMDKADRFFNTKACKALIEEGEIEKGEDMNGYFTRCDGESSREYMYEEQCVWYFLALGKGYLTRGRIAQALRSLKSAEEIGNEVVCDISEFQGYALRKEPSPMVFEELVYGMKDVLMRKDMCNVKILAVQIMLWLFESEVRAKEKKRKRNPDEKDETKKEKDIGSTEVTVTDEELEEERSGMLMLMPPHEKEAYLKEKQKEREELEKLSTSAEASDSTGASADNLGHGKKKKLEKEKKKGTEKERHQAQVKAMEKEVDSKRVKNDEDVSKVTIDRDGKQLIASNKGKWLSLAEAKVNEMQLLIGEKKKKTERLHSMTFTYVTEYSSYLPNGPWTQYSALDSSMFVNYTPESALLQKLPAPLPAAALTLITDECFYRFKVSLLGMKVMLYKGSIEMCVLYIQKMKTEVNLAKNVVGSVLVRMVEEKAEGSEKSNACTENDFKEAIALLDESEKNEEEMEPLEKQRIDEEKAEREREGEHFRFDLAERIEEMECAMHVAVMTVFRVAQLKGTISFPITSSSSASSTAPKPSSSRLITLWNSLFPASVQTLDDANSHFTHSLSFAPALIRPFMPCSQTMPKTQLETPSSSSSSSSSSSFFAGISSSSSFLRASAGYECCCIIADEELDKHHGVCISFSLLPLPEQRPLNEKEKEADSQWKKTVIRIQQERSDYMPYNPRLSFERMLIRKEVEKEEQKRIAEGKEKMIQPLPAELEAIVELDGPAKHFEQFFIHLISANETQLAEAFRAAAGRRFRRSDILHSGENDFVINNIDDEKDNENDSDVDGGAKDENGEVPMPKTTYLKEDGTIIVADNYTSTDSN